jgi:predicted O-methyltransferase YrrM
MKLISSYEDITGWFDFQDIYDEAVNVAQDGDEFLEIGCFMGKSTFYLCEKIKKSEKKINVTVVDTFEPDWSHYFDLINENKGGSLLEIFNRNLYTYNDIIKIVKGRSDDVFHQFNDNQFKMIFIDAAHDYESVRNDLANYYPKLQKGGIFAGHDYFEKDAGVHKAVNEFAENDKISIEIRKSSWFLIKPIL